MIEANRGRAGRALIPALIAAGLASCTNPETTPDDSGLVGSGPGSGAFAGAGPASGVPAPSDTLEVPAAAMVSGPSVPTNSESIPSSPAPSVESVPTSGTAPSASGTSNTGAGGASPNPGAGDQPDAGGGAGPIEPSEPDAGGGAGPIEPSEPDAGAMAPIDEPLSQEGPVTVQLTRTQQEMAGFGINNNWQPAWTDEQADILFGTGPGQLGLTILRIGMNPQGEPYNGADCWSDIEKATERGAEYVIGTLWSPPANMKSNNSITGGGRLLPEHYESWADTIAAFPAKVKQATGVDLYGMSPQNETDFASCGLQEPCNGNYDTTVFTGAEYAEFAAVVGPKLHALDPPVKMIAPEASEWIHVWSNESGCCTIPGNLGSSDPLDCGFPPDNCTDYNDGYMYGYALFHHPTAWQYVDILGTHQYDTQVGEPWPTDVPEKKPVWQTEMSGVKWWPEAGPSTDIANAVAVAGWIHNALTVGEASAWLWWWYRALGDTNEGLLLADGTVAKRQWTLGNYSKFIRPGYTRVDISGAIPEGIEPTAFVGPDGTVVVVVINHNTSAVELPISITGGTTPSAMTPNVTSATDDLAEKAALTVTNGSFTAALGATSVTTFVGR